MLKFIPPRNRIAFGLTGVVIAILCVAKVVGYLPSKETLEIKARAELSESIALGSSVAMINGDTATLDAYLKGVVQRNKRLQSAGVRTDGGELIVCINNHDRKWKPLPESQSTDSQMQVPLYKTADRRWGMVELQYDSIHKSGLAGLAQAMEFEQMFFITSSCFLLFSFLLGLVLKHLDPSKAVPQRVRDALDNLAEGLMIVDTKYNILLANTAFSKVVGKSANKLVGQSSGKLDFSFEQGEFGEQFVPWKIALEEKRPISNSRIRMLDCDGQERIYLVNCSPLLGHQGDYAGVMVTFDDVTKLEESRIKLREARDAADAANQAKSEFLANMSHEIRTPMNAILGFTDVLRRGMEENSDQRIEYLNTIHSSGNHLIELINDILDLSKVEAGKLELESREFSLPQMLRDTTNVLSARASQKQISLGFEVDGVIPNLITSDSTRIKQVLINLVGNAIKFTDQGGVLLNCGYANGNVKIDITDSGIGMTPVQLQRIFDPFSQADTSMTRKFGGTGLGLSISKRFVEALGGTISVQSELNVGSTFSIEVPIEVAENAELLDHDQCMALIRSKSKSAVVENGLSLKPATILVVDDGETNRNLVAVVLKRHKLTVVEAENGKLGLEKALEIKPDVILMDMQMPVMDGYTATAKLREMGDSTPIIALTGNAMQGEKQKCIAAGCDEYLPKPIEIDALVKLLGGFIGFSEEPITERPSSVAEQQPELVAPVQPAPVIQPVSTMPLMPELALDTKESAGSKPAEAAQPVGGSPTIDMNGIVVGMVDAVNSETAENNIAASTQGPMSTQAIEPWTSTLPMDDPEFRSIVEKFVGSLPGKLREMITALEQDDMAQLSDLAHWLKGSGGTVGLNRLTEPSSVLENESKAGNAAACRDSLQEIVALCSAIDLNLVPA